MRFSRLRAAGAAAAAVALVGVISTPAYAGTNSAHSYGYGNCDHTSDGWFEYDGDWFNIKDTCSDGWSAYLKVDVYPYKSGGGYDFAVLGTGGAGWTTSETHNVTEGTSVCISAGIRNKYGEIGGFGAWKCGIA